MTTPDHELPMHVQDHWVGLQRHIRPALEVLLKLARPL